MYLRSAALLAIITIAVPAVADEMKPDEARRFVAGKLFSYSCFDGTNGAGRIYSDGSVAGTVQIGGSGPMRYVTLPSGTIRISTESICASVRGVPFQPCFDVVKTDPASFRGSLAGLGFAYCNFTRRNPRSQMVHANAEVDRPTGSIHGPKPIHSAVILRRSQD
jgi:hypothetical protein